MAPIKIAVSIKNFALEKCDNFVDNDRFEYLFKNGLLAQDAFDALVLVTQSPDYFVPPTSSVIHGRLKLKQDLFCVDINQGCAGFVIGLIYAFMLLDQESVRRVALVNADVLSRKISRKDRNSYPLIGDAAVITLLERQPAFGPIYANLKVDGTRSDVLIIPAGGFRMPSTAETAKMENAGDNNFRAKDHLCMDGSGVFNFVQVEVPPMIEQLFSYAGVKDDDVDWYIFHQPNRFMLHKLADKMKIPYKKMPSNVVEHYGNSSGTTIPVAMVHNLSEKLVSETMHFCIAGFGVGLTWASMYLKIGNLRFCEMMEYP